MITVLLLTGCSGGFSTDEVLQIASIESELMYDGQTKITITYSDESVDPYVFYIPQGEEGKQGTEGNGIKNVAYTHDATNRQTEIVITFTDEGLEPVSFKIPDGLSLTSAIPGTNPITKQPCIYLKYSDGKTSDPIDLPKGDAGNGIKSMSASEVTKEDGLKYYCIKAEYTDGKSDSFEFLAPQDGNGIESMVGNKVFNDEDGKYYYMIDVVFTNSEPQSFDIELPAKWHSGTSMPIDSFGANGDYFFDTEHEKIYLKENGSWSVIVDLKIEKYEIRFDPNGEEDGDGNSDASMPSSALHTYKIERGTYFSANGYGAIPIPTRPGYKFVGWYTSKIPDDATGSKFTDLTPVFDNLTLYARWEKE